MSGVRGGVRAGDGHVAKRERSIEGIVLTAIMLAFTVVLLIATIGLHASSRTVPLAVGLPLAVLLSYRLVRECMGAARSKRTTETETTAQSPTGHPEAAAILWVLALPLASTMLGFIAGPAVWVAAWAGRRGRERVLVALGAGLLTAAFVHLLFERVLGVTLPTGLVGILP